MKKLETLDLSKCYRLKMFPDIQTNMASLVSLRLDHTDIEIFPSSVGQFCTVLVSLNLGWCTNLKRIQDTFHLLESLKDLNLYCNGLLLSQYSTSFKNYIKCVRLQSSHQDSLVSSKFPQFPRFLRKLNLGCCNLGDGDFPSDICELLNLQELVLSENNFSQLPSSISLSSSLKYLDLSYCKSLVKLLDFPSSIAILKANWCTSLESVGDLSNYKWLWKVSLMGVHELIGGDRMLCSMLQVNAVEDRFMSMLPPMVPSNVLTFSDPYWKSMTLKLPHNWYIDFSGFVLCGKYVFNDVCKIVIKQEMLSKGTQLDKLEEFDQNLECDNHAKVGYVPFGSLRHTSWWNHTYTHISFQIHSAACPKVGLVPRKSMSSDLKEGTIDYSEFWDKEREDRKTFEIIDDSIQIVWSH